MYDVEGDAAEEEVGRAERRQLHLLEVRVPHAVRPQLLKQRETEGDNDRERQLESHSTAEMLLNVLPSQCL